jgi:hypothetical protein
VDSDGIHAEQEAACLDGVALGVPCANDLAAMKESKMAPVSLSQKLRQFASVDGGRLLGAFLTFGGCEERAGP